MIIEKKMKKVNKIFKYKKKIKSSKLIKNFLNLLLYKLINKKINYKINNQNNLNKFKEKVYF